MSTRTVRWVIVFATFSILGIVITQIYWVRKAFDLKEKQFNQTIHISLRNVAEKTAKLNQTVLNESPINQISSDYFVVDVNSAIDANVLEHYLKTEFSKRHLYMDFEYGIYDCSTNEMVYGNYVSNKGSSPKLQQKPLPTWDEYIYYFGIRFPNKSTYLASQMDIWIFSSLILLVVIIFFAYTMFVILKQKHLWEVQRDFINNMTHEFKTPISTIAVSTDLLGNPKIAQNPESSANYINIIKKENKRLNHQIEKILQMARLDRGKFKLNKEEIMLVETLEDIIENFKLPNQDKNCQIELKNQIPLNESIVADFVHFSNIIFTLLDNAVKYIEKEAEISVELHKQQNYLALSIVDNGIGIEKKYRKKIFEKFFRVPTGDIHNIKGFGLGLSYVKLICKSHRWKIKLESELGKGSKFIILIPEK